MNLKITFWDALNKGILTTCDNSVCFSNKVKYWGDENNIVFTLNSVTPIFLNYLISFKNTTDAMIFKMTWL